MKLVAIDIGGTNARFALAEIGTNGTITLDEPTIVDPKAFVSLASAFQHFREVCGGELPENAAIALAAPVHTEEISLINIKHWLIRKTGLAERLGVKNLTLINDFGAMGHAAATLGAEYFQHIAGPNYELPKKGTLSIVGPGTGLGVAHIYLDGHGSYHVQSTEGSHGDFAPIDDVDDAILKRLRERYQRVSVERVASGAGVIDIYETLATLEGRAIAPLEADEIWQLADKGTDPLATAAAERFCLALGTAAGNLALAHGASGVVLTGGTAQHQAEKLVASGFHTRFTAKGRFRDLMESIPIKLITHPQPGLYGAAAAFAAEHANE